MVICYNLHSRNSNSNEKYHTNSSTGDKYFSCIFIFYMLHYSALISSILFELHNHKQRKKSIIRNAYCLVGYHKPECY